MDCEAKQLADPVHADPPVAGGREHASQQVGPALDHQVSEALEAITVRCTSSRRGWRRSGVGCWRVREGVEVTD